MSEKQVFTGVTAWFDPKRGFGFITKDDGSGDIFVHFSNIEVEGFRTLKQGQVVSFTVGANQRGPQAENVKVLRDS